VRLSIGYAPQVRMVLHLDVDDAGARGGRHASPSLPSVRRGGRRRGATRTRRICAPSCAPFIRPRPAPPRAEGRRRPLPAGSGRLRTLVAPPQEPGR
jgi:hypothetical protein